jgi:hypothetical protein
MGRYNEIVASMRQQMKHQVVSITLGHWTSNATRNYLGMTAHYINDNWIIRQNDLRFLLHEGKAASSATKQDNIKKLFNRQCLEPPHAAAITTDTEGKMSSFGMQLCDGLNIDHPYCVDRNIHLNAKHVCDDMSFGYDAAENIVSSFKATRQWLVTAGHQHRQLSSLQKH